MGKKKDKAEKKKTKKKKKPKAKSTATPNPVETQPVIASESEIIESADNTSIDGLIELVKILDQNIEQIKQSNRELHQEISQNQQKLQQQNAIYKYICIALTVGIIVTGYNTVTLNKRLTETRGKLSSEMTTQIEAINASVKTISTDIDQLNSSIETLTTRVSTIQQDINKLEVENKEENTDSISKPYNPWSTTHPGQNRSYWR